MATNNLITFLSAFYLIFVFNTEANALCCNGGSRLGGDSLLVQRPSSLTGPMIDDMSLPNKAYFDSMAVAINQASVAKRRWKVEQIFIGPHKLVQFDQLPKNKIAIQTLLAGFLRTGISSIEDPEVKAIVEQLRKNGLNKNYVHQVSFKYKEVCHTDDGDHALATTPGIKGADICVSFDRISRDVVRDPSIIAAKLQLRYQHVEGAPGSLPLLKNLKSTYEIERPADSANRYQVGDIRNLTAWVVGLLYHDLARHFDFQDEDHKLARGIAKAFAIYNTMLVRSVNYPNHISHEVYPTIDVSNPWLNNSINKGFYVKFSIPAACQVNRDGTKIRFELLSGPKNNLKMTVVPGDMTKINFSSINAEILQQGFTLKDGPVVYPSTSNYTNMRLYLQAVFDPAEVDARYRYSTAFPCNERVELTIFDQNKVKVVNLFRDPSRLGYVSGLTFELNYIPTEMFANLY